MWQAIWFDSKSTISTRTHSGASCKTEGCAAAYSPHLELSTDSIPDLNWGEKQAILMNPTSGLTVSHIRIYTYTHIHIYTYTHIHIYTYTHIHICWPYGWLARTFRWTVPRQPSSIQRSSAMSLWLCQLQFCDSRTTRSMQTWHLERIMTIGRSPSSSSQSVPRSAAPGGD